MGIASSDILFKLSKNSGPGNSSAQSDPNDSIGGFMSSTQIVGSTMLNLFDKISGTENTASVTDYRCFFLHNNHAVLTWEAVQVWVNAEITGGATVAIGLDAAGVVDYNSSSAMADRPANELTAPSGVTFTSPTTKAAGVSPGNIGPGKACAVWVKRSAANTVGDDPDGATVRAEGETAAA